MRLSMHELNLQEMRERYRVIHEQNLKQLDQKNCQVKEFQQVLIQPKIQPNSVDVRV
jgi:hypothetical protein